MTPRQIYLGFNASTLIAPEVADAMRPYLTDHHVGSRASTWRARARTFSSTRPARPANSSPASVWLQPCGPHSKRASPHLRFFLELVRTGSHTRAAERMGVDRNTVARRVAALEADPGAVLVTAVMAATPSSQAPSGTRSRGISPVGGEASTASATPLLGRGLGATESSPSTRSAW